MREWAELEIQQGRAIGMGGVGGSATLREWQKSRAVKTE